MLIFIITSAFPSNTNSQSGIFVYEQCRALEKIGHSVVVLDASSMNYRNWANETCRRPIKHVIKDTVIYTYNYCGFCNSKLPLWASRSYMKNLRAIYEMAVSDFGTPNYFWAHFTFTSGYATSVLSREKNIPFVVTEHSSLFLQRKVHSQIRRMLIKTVNSAKEFVCVSDNLKENILSLTGTRKEIKVIPNMIGDIFSYSPVDGTALFTFFSAGNLVKSKRFDLLIMAFTDSFSKNDDVYLDIAGNGSEMPALKLMIKELDRENQIFLRGRLSAEQMLTYYQKSRVFVLPSQFETFGIVYREAMAVGRPIISTRNGGIEDGWKDSHGILIATDSRNELSDALIQMYQNIDRYDNREISNDCIERYSAANVAPRIAAVFEEKERLE